MGLDISAYSSLKKLDVLFDAHGEPIDPQTRESLDYHDYTQITVNGDFPGRADPLEDRACYSYDEEFGFRAGSYGGYNGWREELAEMAGYPKVAFERVQGYAPSTVQSCSAAAWAGKAEGLPFVELVNFSDCEGTIGPVAAAKLAKDFDAFDAKAAAVGGYFYEKYKDWRKAFEMAAKDGCVRFH